MNPQNQNVDIEALYTERFDDFVEIYDRLYEETGSFLEDDIQKSLECISIILETFFGEIETNQALKDLMLSFFPTESDGVCWREIFEENASEFHGEIGVGKLFRDLTAYGDYGFVLEPFREVEQRRHYLEGQIQKAEALLSVLPVEKWEIKGKLFVSKLEKAIARWKLDNGQNLTLAEAVLLSGKALQTVKNAFSGPFKGLNKDSKRGEIKAAAYHAWLKGVKGFRYSIWELQFDEKAVSYKETLDEEMWFLPVAKDGSVFTPEIKRDDIYVIGPEGRETEHADFEEALAALQRMSTPFWRRPSQQGVWTRVSAVEWRRYRKRGPEGADDL